MGHIRNFNIKLTWLIIFVFCSFFILLISNMLVGGLHEDLKEDLGCWTHINCTLAKKIM